jgi:hypothetical protein
MIFTVICNEATYLNQVIDWYNSNHKTDFKISKIIDDEVSFAEIEVLRYKQSDLFDLGYQFGVKEQMLRQEGKIDW